MNLNSHKSKAHIVVATLFLLLAISLESLMYVYWSFVLDPRLRTEAQSNAKILAESQSKVISTVLSAKLQAITQDDIDELTDQILVFIDPELNRPFFLGISLEIDYEVVESSSDSLDLSEGDMQCQPCFPVTTALYSQTSDELLGVASFMVSDAFYEKLKNDVKHILLLESLIGLAVLFVVWIAVNFLVRKLNFEILSRKKIAGELRRAKESAEKASQTKSDFLANMSHEIRTPLNAIIGMAYILSKSSLNKQQSDLLNKLDSSSKLLLNLINDLLDFSKIEAGKLELESTAFKIDEVLDNLAKLVMTKAGEKGLDIMYYTSRDIQSQLIGDPLRLGQVLLNLVNNAIKFTENGEILLSVEVLDEKKSATPLENAICLQFSIRDTGIGIKAEDIDKLFQSFTQADTSTTRKFGGTGLGLSICKQLIHLMGGEISVESVYGQGSTFSFTANFSLATEKDPIVHTMPANIQATHVLVIDDSKVSQNVFQQMLDCFGFRVSTATSAQEGIKLVKQYAQADPIELILMDWQMPEMNGVEATHIIKTQLDLEKPPAIILVTAYANYNVSTHNQAEWDDYLTKPISQSVLYDSIVNIFSMPKAMTTAIEHSASPAFLSLADKQVLLTEDNSTNQEVACALMEELNLQVSIAKNGKEAVEAIKSQHFDLIFMDLQMPVMDGFEATDIIRQDKNYQAVPIIAMTAHAMQGDREKCLQAQMDDYLTKPIDVDKFFAMLEKWLGSTTPDTNKKPIGQNVLVNTNAKANKPLQSTLSQVASINLNKALERVRGKQDLLLRLLINFKNQKADIGKKITSAMQQNDLDSAKALVHSLKGEAGTLEATTLFVAAKNLEQQLVLQDQDQQQVFLAAVTQNLEIVLEDIAILEQELKSQQPEHPIPSPRQAAEASIDVSSLRPQLEELTKLLRDNNLRAKKLAKELTPKLAISKHRARWEDLLQALSELDFDLAQEHLQTLAIELEISI